MEIINFKRRDFSNFRQFKLSSDILSTEASFYWLDDKHLIKRYKTLTRDYLDGAIYTIDNLTKYKSVINIDELVIPKSLMSINHRVCGYIVDFIDGVNLSKILYDPKVSIQQKMHYLKLVGMSLEKMQGVRDTTCLTDFFIGDLHEDNIMVDRNGEIRFLDLDSCKINNNVTSSSKYLTEIWYCGRIECIDHKYIQTFDRFGYGAIVPSSDSDLYCYNIMIMNTLLQGDITCYGLADFNRYIDFLYNKGVSVDLVNSFSKLYSNLYPNENPYKFLDLVDDNWGKVYSKKFFNSRI